MVRNRWASGQAEAKATRMRVAVSMTRAAILRRRRRIVANSALASAAPFGMACWTRHISQYAAVCRIRRIWLALADRQDVQSLESWLLCNLIRFSALPLIGPPGRAQSAR